jgi:hypothetical protein
LPDPDLKNLLELGKKARFAMFIDLLNRVQANQSLSPSEYRMMLDLEAEFREMRQAVESSSSLSQDIQQPPSIFENLLKALDYLQTQGYRIKKSSLYNHKNAGLLKPNPAGSYDSVELDRYAAANLTRIKGSGSAPDDPAQQRLEKFQEEKIRLAVETGREVLKREQRKNLDIDHEIENRIGREFANILNLYKNIITNYFTSESQALIDLVKGDQQFAPEFIAASRQGITNSGITVARHKGMDVSVAPDGTLINNKETTS